MPDRINPTPPSSPNRPVQPAHARPGAPSDADSKLARLIDQYDNVQANPTAPPAQKQALRSQLADEVARQISNGTLRDSVSRLPGHQQKTLARIEQQDAQFRDQYRSKLPNKFAAEDTSAYFVAGQNADAAPGSQSLDAIKEQERALRNPQGGARSEAQTGSSEAMAQQHVGRLLHDGGSAEKAGLTAALDQMERFIQSDVKGKNKRPLLDELSRLKRNVTNVNIEAEGVKPIADDIGKFTRTLETQLSPEQRSRLQSQMVESATQALAPPTGEQYASMSPRARRAALDPKTLQKLPADVQKQLQSELGAAQTALGALGGAASTDGLSAAQKQKVGDSFQAFASSSLGPQMSEAQINKLPEPVQKRAREFNQERQQHSFKAEQTHSEIMGLLHSNLPIEMVIFLVMSLFTNQAEDKLKLKMKEMTMADQMERSQRQMQGAQSPTAQAGAQKGARAAGANPARAAAASNSADAGTDPLSATQPGGDAKAASSTQRAASEPRAGGGANASTDAKAAPRPETAAQQDLQSGKVVNPEDAGVLMKSSTQLNQEVQKLMSEVSQLTQALSRVLSSLQDMNSTPIRNIR